VAIRKVPDERNQINPMSDAFRRRAREFVERLPSLLCVRTLIESNKPTKAKLDKKVRYLEIVSSNSSDMTISL
jgi:hypothetical protein